MRITIVGCGSRGSKLAEAADKMMEVKRIYLVDTDRTRAEAVASTINKAEVVDDVLRVFQADGKAHQSRIDAGRPQLFVGELAVCV